MVRSELAELLVKTRGKRERQRLLSANASLLDAELAREIKEICYRSWTSEPAIARQALTVIDEVAASVDDRETDAFRDWVGGIASITKGELGSAAVLLNAASSKFKKLGQRLESAQPMVAELLALAMLGRYADAERTGRNALKIFEEHGDELAAGKIELNLSNLASRQEKHRLAEKHGLAAVERFTNAGEATWRTMAENSLANTYAELGDLARAEHFYLKALENAGRAKMTVTEAEIEASLGGLELSRGRFAEALRLFESSRRKYDELAMPHQSAIAELEIADIYLELNLTNQAFEIYKRVSPIFKRLRMRAEEARSRANFGRTALKIGKISAAKRQLNVAIKLYEAEQNNFAAAACRLELARMESDAGDHSAAAELAASASAVLKKSENPRRQLAAEWVEAEIMLRSGDRRVRKKLTAFIEKAGSHDQAAYVQAGLNAMGRLEMRSGKKADARTYFERSAAMVEMMRSPLPAEEFALAFMAERIEPYRELTDLAIADGRFREAFIWNERSRSRSLADSMSAASVAGPNMFAAETHRLRDELNRQYKLLDSAAGEADKLMRKIGSLERRLATATRRKQSLAGNGHAPQTAFGERDLKLIMDRLGSGRALVEFMLTGDEIGAFVLADGEVSFFPALASNGEIAAAIRSLRFQFESLKYGQNVEAFAASLRKKADVLLTRLYEKLVRPLREAIGGRDLVVVPAGAIHFAPFHAFKDEDRYLIEEREVVYAPSAAVWSRLQKDDGSRFENALLIAFADEKIPLVESEVREIGKLLSRAETLSGTDATFERYLDRSGSADLIHFACHGSFRPDDPMNSSLHLADGWVTVNDICRQQLRARLVTLSACESGVNDIAAGEEILGLSRGFLTAGAASVLMTLWTVNDRATAELMTEFYGPYTNGGSAAAALRHAQREMIRRGEHPYFWAPFVLVSG